MREVAIAGVGIAKFGRYDGQKGRPNKEAEDLGEEAIIEALRYADMEWKDIQETFAGSCEQGMAIGHRCIGRIGETGIPVTNVEGGCSTSLIALRHAYQAVATGFCDVVLALGVEKLKPGLLGAWPDPIWKKMMGLDVIPAQYACNMVRYMEDTGSTMEDFARVAVLERHNASLNPKAMFFDAGEITIEEVLNSRMVAWPLTLLMCSANADGATAVIVCSREKLKSKEKVITIAASVQTGGVYGRGETEGKAGGSVKIKNLNHGELGAKQVWETSGYGPEDMDVIGVYDAFSPSFLWDLEEAGYCELGEARRLLKEGYFEIGGKLPVNTDGGIMGRGHPTGATGLAFAIEIFRQLREEAGPRQVARAKIGICHTMGAGPNSVFTMLKR
jgi:acetyl-CoA acetyltransferase